MSSLYAATQVKQEDPYTYSAVFDDKWTIGSVPHGGYVAATFQQVIKKHFDTTLAKQKQHDSISMHFEFVRRTEVGPATFVVKEVKLGRQTSTIHITLNQKGRDEVHCYATNINFADEQGVSFDTAWKLNPPRPPIDLSKLADGHDELWAERRVWPWANFRKAPENVRFFFPRAGQPHASIVDQWVCLKNGESWTAESLGFVADAFPQMIELFAMGMDPYSIALQDKMDIREQEKTYKNPGYWFPTVLLNLDIKKALPSDPHGDAKWLYVRLQAKQIRNGRFDLEVIIMDAAGDLVALSHHVCLCVSVSRNIATRRPPEQTKL